MELSVVIPAYNEVRRIGPTLDRIRIYLQEDLPYHEIILVDDGSTDDTIRVAQNVGGGFAFDVELLYLVRLKGFSLAELPVVWLDKEESKVLLLRDGWKMVGDLLRIRFDQWSGKYGKKNP